MVRSLIRLCGTLISMATNTPDGKIVLPIAQEELQVKVRTVDTGRGVRVHKTVSEQTHAIDQALLHDTVDVQRVVVDRIVPVSEAPVTRQEGDTLIVPILEEVLVVEKRVRIKEELHITRTARQEHLSDTAVLRSEHVTIARFDESTEP